MNLETRKNLKEGDDLIYVVAGQIMDRGVVTRVTPEGVGVSWMGGKGSGYWRFEGSKFNWDNVDRSPATPKGVEMCLLDKVCKERDDYKRELDKIERTAADLRVEMEHRGEVITRLNTRIENLREAIKKAWKQGAENRRLANAWEEDARRFNRNETWLRDLLLQIAEVLGPEKFISDDGSIQDEPLIAKIPELAREAIMGPLARERKLRNAPMVVCDGQIDSTPVAQAVVNNGGKLPAGQHLVGVDLANAEVSVVWMLCKDGNYAVDHESFVRQSKQAQKDMQAKGYRAILEAAGFMVAEEPQSGPYDAIVTNAKGDRFGGVIAR